MNGNRMNGSGRFLELDVMRGLAALAVVLYHYTTRFNELYGHADGLGFELSAGRYGVELFFIISGFVIFMTLGRTRTWLDFLVSRLSRLYPSYWTGLILTFAITTLAGLPGREVRLVDACVNLSMIQFWFQIPHVDGVYWTLSIELSFYALMLVLFSANLLSRIEVVSAVWLSLMAIVAITQKHFGITLPDRVSVTLLLTYGHLFIAGMMFHQIMTRGASVARYALIGSSVVVQWLVSSFVPAVIIAGFIVIFELAMRGYLSQIVRKPLVFFGTISYALYLIHQNIGYVILRFFTEYRIDPHLGIAAACSVSVGLASVMTYLVERPLHQAIRQKYAGLRTMLSRTAPAASGFGDMRKGGFESA